MPSASTLIITIDGPAGTGKSTVAHKLAKRLGLEFLDTGAMYRAAALIALESGIAPDRAHAQQLADTVRNADLHFDWRTTHGQPPRLLLSDRDITQRIRDMDVSEIVSLVAALPEVRRVLVEQQRRIAAKHPRLVTEGRDQGSVVFPDAAVRFYLHAAVEVRAERRMAQLAQTGKAIDPEHVMHDIRRRDAIDSTRADGPLIRPEGATDIDTGRRSADEVVDAMEAVVRREVSMDAGLRV